MRFQLVLMLLCACGGSQGDAAQPTAEPVTPPTSEPTAAPTTPPRREPTSGKPEQKADEGDQWSIETGSAKGVTLSNDVGGSLSLKTFAWTSFLRKTKPLGNKAMPNANVSFATVTADDAVVTDVVCTLPAWAEFPQDPTTLAATLIPLAVKDGVPAASIAKVKPALLSCAGGKQLRVEWEFKESKLVSSKVDGGDAKTNACVKTALAKTFMFESGVCAATLAP